MTIYGSDLHLGPPGSMVVTSYGCEIIAGLDCMDVRISSQCRAIVGRVCVAIP